MNARKSCFFVLASSLTLVACTSGNDYPSLSRRPAERISGSVGVVAATPAPAPLPPPSPEFGARLSQLVEQARTAHQRFTARRGVAEQRVGAAGGAAVASESWSLASIALADLEASRSEAMVALAELDAIFAAESIDATETGNPAKRDAASAARDQVTTMVGEEDDVLARLRGHLRG